MLDSQASLNRDGRVRDALYQTRLLVNRTPHFNKSTRKEANRAIDILERQLGLNQVDAFDAARGVELLNRAHASLAFGLLRNQDFADRFGPGLRKLGLRGLTERLAEVPSSIMAEPIPGPIGKREHRDELPADERFDAEGHPLPPPPGFGTPSSLNAGAGRIGTLDGRRSQDVKVSPVVSALALLALVAIAVATLVEGVQDGFSLWDWVVIGLAGFGAIALLVGLVAYVVALWRR
jgi:hypothetical protein